MYEITKDFIFSMSHRLWGLSDNHPCSRLHGHNYTVRFILRSNRLDFTGFVRDYRELDVVKKWIDDTFDHRDSIDIGVLRGINPTAENMAREIFVRWAKEIPELVGVSVSETAKTWAHYMDDERLRELHNATTARR